MTEIRELALTESRSLREQYADRTDVLARVKTLAMLPNDLHVTTEMVAVYFEVPVETVKSVVKDNRVELESNGYATMRGESLRSLKDLCGISPQVKSLAVFSRRAVLNVGQLLRDSEVAKAVRTYLLDAEVAPTATEMTKVDWIRQALEIEQQREQLAIENAKLKIKADAFDLWINGKGVYLVGTVAKMRGINLGPKTLWDFLYAEKLLIKAPGTKRHREPYARPDTENWFDVNPVPPERTNGHATSTTCITAYGAEQIRLLLIRRGVIASEQLTLISGGQDSLFGEAI